MAAQQRSRAARDQNWQRGWRFWAWFVPLILFVVPLWVTPYLGRGLATLFPSVLAQAVAGGTLAVTFAVLAIPAGRREPGEPYPTVRSAAAFSVFMTMLILAPLSGRGDSVAPHAAHSTPVLVWTTYATYPILGVVFWLTTHRSEDRRLVWVDQRQREHRHEPVDNQARFRMEPRLAWWALVPMALVHTPTLVGVLA